MADEKLKVRNTFKMQKGNPEALKVFMGVVSEAVVEYGDFLAENPDKRFTFELKLTAVEAD